MLRRRGAFSVELLRGRDGSWETVESCVVRTSASVYRRLQESPAARPAPMSGEAPVAWGLPPEPGSPGSPPPRLGSFPASGRLLKSESEDSGVEMASNENSPRTPLGSESGFSLDGFQPAHGDPEKSRLGEEPAPRERPPRGLSASKKLAQAAQRSRRQRAPGRSPRQLGRRSASAADLEALARRGRRGAEPRGGPSASQEPSVEPLEGDGQPAPGQGLRYLEHVCQMLERIARLQQANRQLQLQQQAAESRHQGPAAAAASAPATPAREEPRRSDRFRARSSSDSQALAEPRWSPAPCRRAPGHAASSPSLLEPPPPPPPGEAEMEAEAEAGAGRRRWGRVKALLTRVARRSLRGRAAPPR
ncbi:uncharacterized protein C8orf58 homolog isoform X2 [Apteryx mantelli]|uniref:Uncharacterized protein C8orf58 homolog isoform X2 n=1 Tax=Apteryx mantelli TaxID=2696672 RepID=A0ABM4FU70_9AVES